MNEDDIDKLHSNYRAALKAYASARNLVQDQGKILTSVGSAISAPQSRIAIWNVLCSESKSTSERSDKAHYAHNIPTTVELTGSISDWREKAELLINLHKDLAAAGESSNAAPLPADLKNGPRTNRL